MIFLSHPVFSKKCGKEAERRLLNFADQVAFLEYTLSETGYEPIRFDLGRDDSYQFFIFTLGNHSVEAGTLLEEKLEAVIRRNKLDLINKVYSYKCSRCENLHLIFYIKSLSKKNPFKGGEFEDIFYACDANTSFFIN
jgi:hypothetical protein